MGSVSMRAVDVQAYNEAISAKDNAVSIVPVMQKTKP